MAFLIAPRRAVSGTGVLAWSNFVAVLTIGAFDPRSRTIPQEIIGTTSSVGVRSILDQLRERAAQFGAVISKKNADTARSSVL